MVGLLIDANVSYRIKKLLAQKFPSIQHASALPNHPLKDIEFWEFAKKESLVIITYDEDYIDIQTLKGFPPKIIWLRFGNQPTVYIANKLLLYETEIQNFIGSEELGVLEIY